MNCDSLKEMLRRHEGLRLKPYLCPAGKRTIGYGWNIEAHALPPDIAACLRVTGAITVEMAERLLDISIEATTEDCRDIYPGFDGFSEARRFALIDFVFNVGATVALKFKNMRAAIKALNWARAADEMYFSRWREQVGDRATEVIGMVREG